MLVQTDLLTKQYAGVTALDGCSLGVERGEVFGLLGPNGAGKTTLIRLLMGFLQPTSGTARVDGHDCQHDSLAVRRKVSYLPGEARLFRHLRGRETLEFFAQVRPGGDLAKSLRIAERLDLDLARRVAFMSTGMRQKLALAITLSARVPLLILDEPTANLDPSVRGEILVLVGEAQRSGCTVMFSSHVLSEIEDACDRVVILRAGRLVHTQVITELKQQHRIHARLTGTLAAPPEALCEQLLIHRNGDHHVTIETPGELSPLLGWLATLPLAEMRVEPLGLRAVYDRFHAPQANEVSP